MKINPVSNKSQTIEEHIFGSLNNISEIIIASAFIDEYSIGIIDEILKLPKNKRPTIRFLTGVFSRLNRKKNFEKLKELNETYHGFVDVRISKNFKFHWKYYALIKTNKTTSFYIGSSNFTENGLSSTGEFLVNLQIENNKSDCKSLIAEFDNQFKIENAIKIDLFDLDEYIEANLSSQVNNRADRKLEIELNKSKKNEKKIVEENVSIRSFMIGLKIQHYMTNAERIKVEKKNSHWKNKDYDYFSLGNSSNFFGRVNKAKYLLNFYLSKKVYKMTLGKIIESDKIEDLYYVAFELVKEIDISKAIGLKLSKCDIDYKKRINNWNDSYLNKSQIKVIEKLFKQELI